MGPIPDPIAIVKVGMAGVSVTNVSFMVAAARAQRARPAGVAIVLGIDMAAAQKIGLLGAVDAILEARDGDSVWRIAIATCRVEGAGVALRWSSAALEALHMRLAPLAGEMLRRYGLEAAAHAVDLPEPDADLDDWARLLPSFAAHVAAAAQAPIGVVLPAGFAAAERLTDEAVGRLRVALRDNGVDPKFIQGMLRAGFGTPSPKDLINLHNNGVSPDYARKAVGAGIPNLNVERMIHLAQNGVDLDNVQRIHALGFGPFSFEQLIELHNNGVSSGLFESLKESGYTKIDAHQAVEAQQSGLSPKSLRNLREQGFKGLTFEQVMKLCRAGVI